MAVTLRWVPGRPLELGALMVKASACEEDEAEESVEGGDGAEVCSASQEMLKPEKERSGFWT